MEPKELQLEETETHKEFYIGVNYYGGTAPYPCLFHDLSDQSIKFDEIHKIRLPYRLTPPSESTPN